MPKKRKERSPVFKKQDFLFKIVELVNLNQADFLNMAFILQILRPELTPFLKILTLRLQ